MSTFTRRYTPEQIAAVIAACIDGPRRRSVPDVLRAAAAGTLEHEGTRLDAFDGNVGTFRAYVADELRQRRRADVIDAGGGNAAAELAARLVAVGEREVTRLEKRAAKGEATPAQIRSVAAMIRELVRLAADAGVRGPGEDEPAAGGPSPTSSSPTSPDTGGLAAELAAAEPTTPAPIV